MFLPVVESSIVTKNRQNSLCPFQTLQMANWRYVLHMFACLSYRRYIKILGLRQPGPHWRVRISGTCSWLAMSRNIQYKYFNKIEVERK